MKNIGIIQTHINNILSIYLDTHIVGGDKASIIVDKYQTAVTGDNGTSISGNKGSAVSGNLGVAKSGYKGISTTKKGGMAISENYGTSTTGDGGIAMAGIGGIVSAGKNGILQIKYIDNMGNVRIACGYIGKAGLKENTHYKLDINNNFTIAEWGV